MTETRHARALVWSIAFFAQLHWATLWVDGTPVQPLEKQQFSRINECARQMAHYSPGTNEAVYKSQGCVLNTLFTEKRVSKILTGTSISAVELPLSFKQPIDVYGFAWSESSKEPTEEFVREQNVKKSLLRKQKKDGEKCAQYMFNTKDGKFLIESIPKHEFETAQESIALYAEHIQQHPESMLARVVGMFGVDNMYFSVFVAPLSIQPKANNYAFEFSHETEKSLLTEDQKYGLVPYPYSQWSEVSCNSPGQLLDVENTTFSSIYMEDLWFLRSNNYMGYQFFIGLPVAERFQGSTWVQGSLPALQVGQYYQLQFFQNIVNVSFTLTHIFSHKSRQSEKAVIYSDSFDTFRNTKVVYSRKEGKSIVHKTTGKKSSGILSSKKSNVKETHF